MKKLFFTDLLTSCIGMTVSQMLTERKKQGWELTEHPLCEDSRHWFKQKFPELEYELLLCNSVVNNTIASCGLEYIEYDEYQRLFDEFEQALIRCGLKYQTRSFYNRYNGTVAQMSGYFLPNGEFIDDYDWQINKVPNEYITPQNYSR